MGKIKDWLRYIYTVAVLGKTCRFRSAVTLAKTGLCMVSLFALVGFHHNFFASEVGGVRGELIECLK